MMWTMIRPSSPPCMPRTLTVRTIGMRIAWYGMNMPNRISGKTKSAPGNRHFDRTNPLAAPRTEEITLTGTASSTLLMKPGPSFGHTAWNPLSEIELGSSHMRETVTSAGFFTEVTTSTYTGMRKNRTNAKSARCRPSTEAGAQRDRIGVGPVGGASGVAAAGAGAGGGTVWVVMSGAPIGPSTR